MATLECWNKAISRSSAESATTCQSQKTMYDLVGLGFGPANLAIAITVVEEGHRKLGRKLSTVYLERQPRFDWHAGMMLNDSRMQVVFLKDLATMRNPQSKYTFINYLFNKNRLHEFINLRSFFPKRLEFNSYYQWVAQDFAAQVRYHRHIKQVLPVHDAKGNVYALEVRAHNLHTRQEESLYTTALTVALGGKPFVPGNIQTSNRIFHSAASKFQLDNHFSNRQGTYHFVVVGSGQTAADVVYHLITQYPKAKVTMVIRGFAYRPQDDTHFVNELFFPEIPDFFYNLDDANRRKLLAEYADVTHSAVDIDLIPLIYDAMYYDKMEGKHQMKLRRFLELKEASEVGQVVHVVFKDLIHDCQEEIQCDALIMATGYDFKKALSILTDLDPYLLKDQQDTYVVGRNYDIQCQPGFCPKIYLQGYCEATHGFSEILLSLLPLRSRQVVDDLIEHLLSPIHVTPQL